MQALAQRGGLTSRVRLAVPLAILLAAAGGCGSESAAKEAKAPSKQTTAGKEAARPATVALGEILVRQLRPLENSTLNVRFQVHAAAAEGEAERLKKVLTVHHHQAREQVIIAVRTAETWEFDEPDLRKLRRRILLGLNRWLDAPLVADVVLTEFRFRMD